MHRASALLAALVVAASCAACGGGENTNSLSRPLQKTDRITVEYPNLFLQDDQSVRGKVTFELQETGGEVVPIEVSNGNSTRVTDQPRVSVRPRDPERYDTYVEVRLSGDGLDVIGPPNPRQRYVGDRLIWEWTLKPSAGRAEGAEVSFSFHVDVTRQAKTGGAAAEELPDIWPRTFTARVGPPAPLVDAALYSSPLLGFGGLVTLGLSLRKRKVLQGVEGEEGEGPAGGERAVAAAGADLEEEVSGTVYAPGQAGPGEGFLVQVFVHLPEQAASLDELAREADEDARRRISNPLRKKIRRGTELSFYLLMPGLDVDEPVQTCVWGGEPACVQFGVTVPEGCAPKSLLGTVTVSEHSVPIGHLKFKFKVTAAPAAASAPAPAAAGEMVRYRQAFISYASTDRPEVLKRVQMLNLAKIKFFQDLLTLEPGDRWEQLLYEYIDQSDVFFLFWSTAASRSEWVKREVEYAIRTGAGAGPEIIPVIIEGPPPAPPPAELSSLHFNDKLLYFINAPGGGAA